MADRIEPGRRERLSPADASNILMDAYDQVNVFLMAGVLAPGGPIGPDAEPDVAALRRAFAEVVPLAPRLMQRIVPDRRGFAWEPVPLDLEAHVRLLDAVDGVRGLEALCAALMVTPLPLDRPMWELLLVPGVEPGRLGVVFRIHHAIADGLAAVRLVELLMPPVTRSGGADVADPTPDGENVDARRTTAVRPSAATSRARWRTLASGWERTVAILRPAVPRTILLGRIGPRRGVAFAEAPLDGLAAGAGTVGATVNDALLAAAVAAAEAALRVRGEPVPPVLPVNVPVALAERGRSGNAVGVMLVPLPSGISDVATRLRRIAELTRARKADARSRGTFELTRTRFGTTLFFRFVRYQRLIVMFASNVRGPRHPLALAGAPLEQVWPVGPIQGNVRLGVAALSYDGVLRCGVHVDADALDAEVFGDALRRELERVAALA